MKQKLLFTLILLMLCTLAGCKQETISSSYNNEDWVYVRDKTTKGALSDNGYYYLNGYILSYADFGTEKSIALCAKAGCNHKDDTCDAYLVADTAMPMYFWEDHLYYVPDNVVYRRNAIGGDLAEVGGLGMKYIQQSKSVDVRDCVVAHGYLFYLADIRENVIDETGTSTAVLTTKYIGRMQLSTGKDEILVEEEMDAESENLILCAAQKDGVLLQYVEGVNIDRNDPTYIEATKNSAVSLKRWDIEANRMDTLFTKTVENFSAVTMVSSGKVYYRSLTTAAQGSGATYTYDLNSGKEELIYPEQNAQQIGGGYLLCLNQETRKYYIYDMNIGEKQPDEIAMTLSPYNVSDKGVVLLATFTQDVDESTVQKNRVCYFVAHGSLADGLQETDLKQLYVERTWTQPKQ